MARTKPSARKSTAGIPPRGTFVDGAVSTPDATPENEHRDDGTPEAGEDNRLGDVPIDLEA